MKKKRKIEKQTISVFDKIHISQLKNKKIYFRLTNLLSTNFLNVKKNFFKNKVCLDAACGANANATLNMLNLGCKFVHAFDINHKAINSAKKVLNKKYKRKYVIKKGNLLNIKYKSNFFDFTHCAGAIHHTVNYKKSINELCRVTKPGGMIFLEFYGKGGVMREITSFFRRKYKKDKKFRTFINNFSKKDLSKILNFIIKTSKVKDNLIKNNLFNSLKENIDEDLLLTIKDRIQSPLYTEFKDQDVIKILKKNNFYKIKRISKYPIFFNIRKYLAPFYYDYNNIFSKFLYGNGMPQLIAIKKK